METRDSCVANPTPDNHFEMVHLLSKSTTANRITNLLDWDLIKFTEIDRYYIKNILLLTLHRNLQLGFVCDSEQGTSDFIANCCRQIICSAEK